MRALPTCGAATREALDVEAHHQVSEGFGRPTRDPRRIHRQRHAFSLDDVHAVWADGQSLFRVLVSRLLLAARSHLDPEPPAVKLFDDEANGGRVA